MFLPIIQCNLDATNESMVSENVAHTHTGILFYYEEQQNHKTFRKMNVNFTFPEKRKQREHNLRNKRCFRKYTSCGEQKMAQDQL